ncbi:hypothetical protein Pcinc_020746 [Petrolisthes cinctipes]|uniref:Uncharacterized protein n=1 Tax=Petrolisthes cinctipes TaxID=88211 RepID=A0AAE1FIG8_PETCI|nr:hypothetical protein Pcinc_020746 [Petrolisthes cinctipes]
MEEMAQSEQHSQDIEARLKNTDNTSDQEDVSQSQDVPHEHQDKPQIQQHIPDKHQDESDRCQKKSQVQELRQSREALRQEVIALEARVMESESRRVKEVESLVEQLLEEQQTRAQDTVKFKAMLAAICQEKDLLVEDVEILQSSLTIEEAEHHDDSLKNNQIISGLKRQYNEVFDENDRLKEEVRSLTSSVEEQRMNNESLVTKNKQLSNVMKNIKQELQEKMEVIQSQELQCNEMECEVRRLEQLLQSAENQWSAEVSDLHTQLRTTRHIHHTLLDSLLLEAVRSGLLHMVTQLLGAGANTEVVNIQSNNGQRALHVAAEEGYKEVTEALLEAGAHHTAHDYHGNLPIHVAARHNCCEVVEVLLKHDPKLTLAPDRQGWTVTQLATSLGHLRILQVVARLQEDILAYTTPEGHTLLHISATNDQLHVSEWLLSNSRLGLRDIIRSHGVLYSQLVHVLLARSLVVAGWFRLSPLIWSIMKWWPLRNLGISFCNWLKRKEETAQRKEYSSLRIQHQEAVCPDGFSSRGCSAKQRAHQAPPKDTIRIVNNTQHLNSADISLAQVPSRTGYLE